MDENEQLSAISQELGIKYIEKISVASITNTYHTTIPLAWVRQNSILPLELNGSPSILTSTIKSFSAQEKVARTLGKQLTTILIPKDELERLTGIIYKTTIENHTQATTTATTTQNAPEIVNHIILRAIQEHASDIHFEPTPTTLKIRNRIDGILYTRETLPKDHELPIISRLKVLASMDIAENRLPQDGMAEVRVQGRTIDIRVSTIPITDGERVVLRLLNQSDTRLPISALGMSESYLKGFKKAMATPNGIIIVSGPTGSGKTTTLYSALGEIDSKSRNILTIEDPVEYRLPNIGQIQVKPKIGLTFASGLRHILRQDPDVILVGETRDPETAQIAVRASLTGHLVFTTLHTNDAPSSVLRLSDMGVEPYLIASCLRAVLGQRLIRTLCPHCRQKLPFPQASQNCDIPLSWLPHLQNKDIYTAQGCPNCLNGYKGRTGIFELMTITPALSSAIRLGTTSPEDFRLIAIKSGMMTMEDDALTRILSGTTDIPEVTGVLP